MFRVRPLAAFRPAPGTFVVTNPPYGERLDLDVATYREIGRVLGGLPDGRLVMLSGAPALEDAMSRRPDRSVPLWNGPIECRLLDYAPAR